MSCRHDFEDIFEDRSGGLRRLPKPHAHHAPETCGRGTVEKSHERREEVNAWFAAGSGGVVPPVNNYGSA